MLMIEEMEAVVAPASGWTAVGFIAGVAFIVILSS